MSDLEQQDVGSERMPRPCDRRSLCRKSLTEFAAEHKLLNHIMPSFGKHVFFCLDSRPQPVKHQTLKRLRVRVLFIFYVSHTDSNCVSYTICADSYIRHKTFHYFTSLILALVSRSITRLVYLITCLIPVCFIRN